MLNVLVFFIKQLVHTIVYQRQLLIINTVPRISFDVRLHRAALAADEANASAA